MSFCEASSRQQLHSNDDLEPVVPVTVWQVENVAAPGCNTFFSGLRLLDDEIDRRMASDVIEAGRFARAYVDLILAERNGGATGIAAAQSRLMLKEPLLYGIWSDWLMARLARHLDTAHASQLNMVHHAAAGVWLAIFLADAFETANEVELRRRMLRLLPW